MDTMTVRNAGKISWRQEFQSRWQDWARLRMTVRRETMTAKSMLKLLRAEK
tara:strand:+ start:729 stop:881 length:153 start_codon:yes stop_codon:yes gene_type:complete